MRNTKVDGIWVQVPCYTVDDTLPYGHGEKSVYMISGFMKLSREESMAINWHMGGFDTRVMGGSYSLSGAFYKYPRPVDDFCGFKEIDGKQVPRFALVNEIKIDLQQFLNEVIKQNDLEL